MNAEYNFHIQSLIRTLSDPRLYVRDWLSHQGVSIQSTGGAVKNGRGVTFKEIQTSAWLDYRALLTAAKQDIPNKVKIAAFKREELVAAFEEYQIEVAEKHRQDAIERTNCSGEDLTELTKFVIAVAGADDLEFHTAILAHFIWQIKRKMRGLPVERHLMPILCGRQNGGKSTAIEKLLSPISDWVLHTNLPALQDERRHFALAENYVAFADEMQQAHKADIEALKNIITSPITTPRIMYGHTVAKVPQNCTFIGATNRSVAELIIDTSGMRRFFEIRTLDRLDWDVLNAIDYGRLFQSVDERRERTYIADFKDQLSVAQADYVAEDHVTMFLEENGLLDGEDCERTAFVPMAVIYDVYSLWCARSGYKPQTIGGLGKSISPRGMKPFAMKSDDRRTRGYRVLPATAEKLHHLAQQKRN